MVDEIQTQSAPESVAARIGKRQLIALIAAIILFAVAALWGFAAGQSSATAQADYANVSALSSALKYYYSDQGRYPSADQFSNQQILVPMYISAMPPAVGSSGPCKGFSQYAYSQSNPTDYTLKFCLVKSFAGLPAGINSATGLNGS